MAADSGEAKAWLDASAYDLVVLDPGFDGFELLPTLGGREPPVPLVVSLSRHGSSHIVHDIAAALGKSALSAELLLSATRAAVRGAPPPPPERAPSRHLALAN